MFVGFVILIVVFAVFKVTSKDKKRQSNESTENKEVVYQDNFRLGICNLDTTNPLTTRNKSLMDIYQLVYEPLLSLDSQYKLNLGHIICLTSFISTTSANIRYKVRKSSQTTDDINNNGMNFIIQYNTQQVIRSALNH